MIATAPAGFWIRGVALLIDVAIFYLVHVSLRWVAGRVWGPTVESEAGILPAVSLFTLLFTSLYTSALHALAGQTLGKLAVGVRVVNEDGTALTFGTALLRYLGYFLSLAPLGVGFIVGGLRRDKRTFHDLLAGTRVERLAPARVAPPARAADPIPPRY
ncbi:MAG TPA: RDD family protein [Methylomirabilota bacterium]|jgi:uncharacterized RDD family membrane protein YckC